VTPRKNKRKRKVILKTTKLKLV